MHYGLLIYSQEYKFIALVMTCTLTVVRGSASQTVDGKIRVRAPIFYIELFLYKCDPEGSRFIPKNRQTTGRDQQPVDTYSKSEADLSFLPRIKFI